MVTREQALHASSPYVWVLVGEVVAGAVVVAGWNLWAYREQLLDRAARLVKI